MISRTTEFKTRGYIETEHSCVKGNNAMRKVLIVEDDPLLRMSLTTVLSDKYEVYAVGSGLEALRFLRRQPVDIVLLDLLMSEGDGIVVLSQLRTLDPAPQVIVHSALKETRRIAKMIRLGATDYLVKPCPADKVRRAIERALAERMAQTKEAEARAYSLSA